MERIRQHFEEEARDFDSIILKLIPFYDQMLEALISAIPFADTDAIRVIDLGCGTGTISQHVLDTFPNARVTCLDMAENMIEMAKAKLSEHPHIRFLVGDLNTFDFDATYDVVMSSLALHHLATDEDKRAFYARIHDALAPGGVFYNADVVLGSSEWLQAMYMTKWQAFMRQNVSQDEMDNTWLPKYYDEDRPAPLVDQTTWLAKIGFADVDVVWKYYNYAVYGGTKV